MVSLPNNSRGLVRLLMIAVVAAQLGSFVARADIDYAIDTTITSAIDSGNPLQTDTVQGSITTDGTIGVLAINNIVSWNLNLIDRLNAANDVDLTNANSSIITFIGSSLTATATGLFFNYSQAPGEFGIQENGFFFSGEHYFCFSTGSGNCLAGETITPADIFTDGVVATGSAEPVGTQPLNQNATPEPSYGLIIMGLLGVCVGVKRKFAL